MKSTRGAEIGISIVFGIITIIICLFLFSVLISLLIGGLTFALFMLALGIILNRDDKKYNNIHEQIEGNILLMERANLYENRYLCNGFLFLTETKLIFISREKKEEIRRDIIISDIRTAEFDKVFRHILGLKIVTYNGSSYGFAQVHSEQFIDKIDELKKTFLTGIRKQLLRIMLRRRK